MSHSGVPGFGRNTPGTDAVIAASVTGAGLAAGLA